LPDVPKRSSQRQIKINWAKFQAKKISLSLKNKKKLLIQTTTGQYQYNIIYSSLVNNKRQSLILVPEINDIAKTGSYLSLKLRQKIAVFHSNLNKNECFNNWLKVLKGEAKIILGTRQAVFAPFLNLDLIVITNENDANYKQWDQNPRYDTRQIAIKLANIAKARLMLLSPAPRVESYHLYQTKQLSYIKETSNQIKTQLIDLGNEFKNGNRSFISEKLSQAILKNKFDKQKIVLYLNRRGLARSVICSDCGYTFICPFCLLPLPLHRGGKLQCHHCFWQTNLPANCPNCRGVQFKFLGQGTETLETGLQKIWPGFNILRLDSDIDTKKITEHQIDSADIYLGTDLLFKLVPWQKVGLVSILLIDNLLYLPDFRAKEKIWQLLKKIEVQTSLSKSNDIYLQTFKPQSDIFQNFYLKKDDIFYQQELVERQELKYPPFSQLIKIIIQGANQVETKKEAEKVYRKLTEFSEYDKINIYINEPTPIYTNRVRGRWRYVIVIKNNFSSHIKSLLKLIPENCLIDVDPENLL
jgi:primosomal protein N' (replication factor Y)